MRKVLINLMFFIVLLCCCVEGAIQVGPSKWPDWMENAPSSSAALPATQPSESEQKDKSILNWIKERL